MARRKCLSSSDSFPVRGKQPARVRRVRAEPPPGGALPVCGAAPRLGARPAWKAAWVFSYCGGPRQESQAPLLPHKAKSGLDRGPRFLPSAGIKGVEGQLPGLGGGPKSGASSPPGLRDRSPEGASGGPQEPRSQKNEFSGHYCFTPEAKVFQEVLG